LRRHLSTTPVLMQVGIKIATSRLGGHEPEFVAAVTPSR
jgi:hypothetical protein